MAILREEEEASGEAEDVELSRAENPWKPACLDPTQLDRDETEALERRALGLLNRLAPQNLPSIAEEWLPLLSAEATPILVGVLFAKAVAEPLYAHVYSQLAAQTVPAAEAFRLALLQTVQAFLGRSSELAALSGPASTSQAALSPLAADVAVAKAKTEVKGCVRFLGELWRAGGVLSGRELGETMGVLVGDGEGEWPLECIYVLLNGAGDALEADPSTRGLLRDYLAMASAALRRPGLSMRLRFLLGHLLYLAHNGWAQRLDEFADGPLHVTN